MDLEPKSRKPNRLISEKSPYLLQHAYNPVGWYPWSPEAFRKAGEEDKPVFLSIGYSTCHWCHVMEKESFEDAEVARLLNDTFACIKVDREERPDLDAEYMKVCQALTGSGGWPLNIIMTSERKPFFAATYIPKESRFGLLGLKELIPRIRTLWASQRQELVSSADKVVNFLKEAEKETRTMRSIEKLGESTLDEAYFQLSNVFDQYNGGFGDSPKFPSPHNLTFLLRYYKRTGDSKALEMVEKTLKSMRLGGIYDHIGFGFHRYSTDPKWRLPHFEKMLYDQAMLTMAYTEAYQVTRKEEYEQTANEVIAYVMRDMTDQNGAFYSAEDADSEGEEGKFYLWTTEEIRKLLADDEAEVIERTFNIKEDGNLEEPSFTKSGKNVLYMTKSLVALASDMQLSLSQFEKIVATSIEKFLYARQKRVRPSKDDKILTDWNGLMIAALSKASQVFGNQTYAEAASKAVTFILEKMLDTNGNLFHRYREGEAGIDGFLDDYAFLVWGLIELYETVFDPRILQHAIELTEKMLECFSDAEQGGLYLTSNTAETSLIKLKEIHDGSYPSGNSVATLNIIRLARMTGKAEFEDKAAQLLRSFSATVSKNPCGHSHLMNALDFVLGPSAEVVIVGDPDSNDTKNMVKALREKFLPRKAVLLVPTSRRNSEIARLADFTKNFTTKDRKATAYVCRNRVCSLPTTSSEEMLKLVDV